MESLHFKKGPSLLVHFLTSPNHIEKIQLFLSDHFEAKIEGPIQLKLLEAIKAWLLAYQNKECSFPLPLNLSSLTPFSNQVLKTLQKTSFGETLSYKELAERSYSPKAYRAVGSTCKGNLFPLIIPCHRVILKNGLIGEFNGGIEIKKRLLQFEEAAIFLNSK